MTPTSDMGKRYHYGLGIILADRLGWPQDVVQWEGLNFQVGAWCRSVCAEELVRAGRFGVPI